jgi:alanine racemase
MSHFSSSEIRDEYGVQQVEKFKKIIDEFQHRGLQPRDIHIANSGAIVNYPDAHFTMVRAGISLYGPRTAGKLKEKLPARQVMKFASKVALIKGFPEGYSLSYGRTYVTGKRTKVAFIPVGYADGYPRALSNRGYVLINNKRFNIIGRICMDWFLVDITECGEVNVQDEVILLGESAANVISADEIGDLAGTIPYEILCNISKKVARVYI